MADEVASLSVSVDGRPAVVSLDEIEVAAQKADKAIASLTKTTTTDAQSRVAQVQADREYVKGLTDRGVSAAKARQELQLLRAAEKDEADAVKASARAAQEAVVAAKKLADTRQQQIASAQQAAKFENALRDQVASSAAATEAKNLAVLASLAKGGDAATGSIRGLGRPLVGLLSQIDGLPPVIGRVGFALSSFAVGGPVAIGVIAGLAAIGGAWYLLTAQTRTAQKQIDDAAKSIEKLHDSQLTGPIKLEIDIQGAVAKLRELDTLVQNTGNNIARGAVLGGGPIGALVAGGYQAFRGNSAARERETVAPGIADAQFKERNDLYINSLEKLAAKGQLAGQQLRDLNNEIARQEGIYGLASRDLAKLSPGSPNRAILADYAANARARADSLADARDRPGEEASREADAARKAGQRLADKAYADLVRGVEDRLKDDKTSVGISRIGITRDAGYSDIFTETARIRREAQIAKDSGLGNLRAEFGSEASSVNANGEGQFGAFSKKVSLVFAGGAESLKSLEGFQAIRKTLGEGLAQSLTDGITSGFETFFKSGSIADGFKSMIGGLLNGLGDAAIKFGSASLALAPIMAAIKSAFQFLDPAGSITGSVALIALGGALKAAAGKMFSGGSGGTSYGSYSGGGVITSGGLYGGDINNRGVVPGAVGGAPSIPSAGAMGGMGAPANLPPMHFTLLGADSPKLQRELAQVVRNAVARNVQGFSDLPGYAGATAG